MELKSRFAAVLILGMVIGTPLLFLVPNLWNQEAQAQDPRRLPGQQCERYESDTKASHCTFKFDDGVRCMSAWDKSGESPSVAISCVYTGASSRPSPEPPGPEPAIGPNPPKDLSVQSKV